MLILAWQALHDLKKEEEFDFITEYRWENFIIRLWLYRGAVNTLAKLPAVRAEAQAAIRRFDDAFQVDGRNGLKSLRDMIEHFDDYAAGAGRGPADRMIDLDPFRHFTKERYERGSFKLDRDESLEAADKLRNDAKTVSDCFIAWYRSSRA